jgi:hypothetical protein
VPPGEPDAPLDSAAGLQKAALDAVRPPKHYNPHRSQ